MSDVFAILAMCVIVCLLGIGLHNMKAANEKATMRAPDLILHDGRHCWVIQGQNNRLVCKADTHSATQPEGDYICANTDQE